MKVLLDECIPRKLKRYLSGHNCVTVPEAGLAGVKNGVLLAAAESRGFGVLITMDKGVGHQQELMHRSISVLILHARSNRVEDLIPLVESCLRELSSIKRGELRRVGPAA